MSDLYSTAVSLAARIKELELDLQASAEKITQLEQTLALTEAKREDCQPRTVGYAIAHLSGRLATVEDVLRRMGVLK